MKRRFRSGNPRRVSRLLVALPLLVAGLLGAESFPDISKLPAQPGLPDPLRMLNGERVTTPEQWVQRRRPELKALFQHYMYGTMPSAPAHLEFAVERVDHHFFGGKATKKEVTINFDAAPNAPRIHLLLLVPNTHQGDLAIRTPETNGSATAVRTFRAPRRFKMNRGFPIFVGLNPCGNHTLVTDTNVALSTAWMSKSCAKCVDNRATEASRGTQVDVWALEQSIDRGYAVATFYCGDIEPDRTNAPDGLRAWLNRAPDGNSAPTPTNDCGTIAAWAWGISRAVDYLVTDKDIDARRIAVTGHSRLGKAATLAAAFDERIALAVPLQAGCGGTAPSRGKTGESVKNINDHFPHWFNVEFKKFNDEPDRLPFDQHCLIALIAPRPVLIGCATEDTWSNPAGQFEMLQAADPVYRFLGTEGLDAEQMPETGKLVGNRLGYFIRPGKHSMTKGDWKMFLDFADKAMP